jgi:hypothetical protein
LRRRTERVERDNAEVSRADEAEQRLRAEHDRRLRQTRSLKEKIPHELDDPLPRLDPVAIAAAQEKSGQAKLTLLGTWSKRYQGLPGAVQIAWDAYHLPNDDVLRLCLGQNLGCEPSMSPRTEPEINPQYADEIEAGRKDPAFAEFGIFNERITRAWKEADDDLNRALNPASDAFIPHGGSTLGEIKDEEERYVLDGVIPEGLTVLYGPPKAGKSAWAHKLALCVSSGTPSDG